MLLPEIARAHPGAFWQTASPDDLPICRHFDRSSLFGLGYFLLRGFEQHV